MKPVAVRDVDCVADVGAILGEAPLWDPREGALYWVDIKGDKLFRFDPGAKATKVFRTRNMLSAIGLHKEGGFIAAGRTGFSRLRIDSDGLRQTDMVDPEADKKGNRFNDGKVDPLGGFWAGTMDNAEADASGAWWRFSPDGKTACLASGFRVTNGPAFDLERKRVFLTDSARQTVFAAETDAAECGALKPFLQFGEGDGYPDGMEIDAEGGLWIAFWDGALLRRFAPDGSFVQAVPMPVPRPTSIAIVDDMLFVTSASIDLQPDTLAAAPLSGGLFRVALDRAVGAPARFFG